MLNTESTNGPKKSRTWDAIRMAWDCTGAYAALLTHVESEHRKMMPCVIQPGIPVSASSEEDIRIALAR
jgi:hypothetical protein